MGRRKKQGGSDSSVTRDLSQTLENASTPGSTAATPKSSSSKRDLKNLAVATECHLSSTPHCKTAESMAFSCSNLIADHLGYDVDSTTKLVSQVERYFKCVGIVSDDTLKLFATSVWPEPTNVVPAHEDTDSLTHAAMLALQDMSKLTAVVRTSGYYLGEHTTHADLVKYAGTHPSHPVRYDARGSGNNGGAGGSREKLPSFTLPKFHGERLDGDDYKNKVERVFRNHGQLLFLLDDEYPGFHTDWSTAYSSRILDSLADSSIMSFMAERLKDETNSYVVWKKVCEHLSTSDLSMTRIMKLWREFFGLRCENLSDFLPFYSKVTKVLDKLQQEKSVAATDDVFLRAFLAKAISCEELQTEVKKFLQDGKGTYDQILEDILTDYRAQETGEELRDGDNTIPKKVRRVDTTHDLKQKSGKVALPKLPSNTGNLIPHSYYLQFKAWYDVMRIPEVSRSDEQKAFISSFKWKHTKNKMPGNSRPGGGGDYNRHPARRNNDRNRIPRQDSHVSRRAHRHRHSRSRSPSSDSDSRRRSRRGRHSSSHRHDRSYSRSRSRSHSPTPRDRSRERSRDESRPSSQSDSNSDNRSRRRVMFDSNNRQG